MMTDDVVLSERNVPRPPLQDELTRLYSQGFLTDITLSTEDGKNFEAHRILLAARSTYFNSVIPRLKSEPVIFLKGIKGSHLDKVLKFIYGTSVTVARHQLKSVLEVGRALQVKGLCDVSTSDVLGRQSVVSAGRFKPDSPLGSPILASSKLSAASGSSKPFTSFKSPHSVAPSSVGRRGRTSSSMSTSSSSKKPEASDSDDGETSTSGKDKNEDEAAEEDEETGPRTRKGRRGRPPKRHHKQDKDKKDEKDKEDPYAFEEEAGNEEAEAESSASSKKGFRYSSKKKSKGDDGDEEEAEEAGDDEEEVLREDLVQSWIANNLPFMLPEIKQPQ